MANNMPKVPMNHAITTCRHRVDKDKFDKNFDEIFGKRCEKHLIEKLPCRRCAEENK
jgi:hypothetical protein